MAQQFNDQGGAASSNPSGFRRWIVSKMMQKVASQEKMNRSRKKTEKRRLQKGAPHQVEYYHQLDDAYSHLAAQALQSLVQTYNIKLVPYLAGPPSGKNAPEPELLLHYSLRDSISIASHYGLSFSPNAALPLSHQLERATRILSAVTPDAFPKVAVEVGEALWTGNDGDLKRLAKQVGETSKSKAESLVLEGTRRRQKLGHYSGAMFYYGGEWYWGIDRLYHLENRLIELGARLSKTNDLIFPRPTIDTGHVRDNGSLTLEFYPSLRSPYSSICFDRTLKMVENSGVNLVMRPVMPMVMRGVSLSMQKGVYIFFDTAREARTLGFKNWGGFYDPIGDPVRRAFSLYPWAREKGRDRALLSSFLQAAFFDAVNTNNDAGLKKVVEDAGLSWQEAQSVIDNTDWEEELEKNRLAMLKLGIWGVPSYRLLDADGNEVLSVWGQDRLWFVAREIKRLLKGT